MSWELTTSGQAIDKAGINANSTVIADTAELEGYYEQAEATFSMRTRHNWNTAPAQGIFVNMIADGISDLIAMKIINTDMSGFTSRLEVQTMLDVLKNNSDSIINDLQLEKHQDVVL